MICVNIASLTR